MVFLPCASASPSRYSKLRILLPPTPSPLRSSRLINSGPQPKSCCKRCIGCSGVGLSANPTLGNCASNSLTCSVVTASASFFSEKRTNKYSPVLFFSLIISDIYATVNQIPLLLHLCQKVLCRFKKASSFSSRHLQSRAKSVIIIKLH